MICPLRTSLGHQQRHKLIRQHAGSVENKANFLVKLLPDVNYQANCQCPNTVTHSKPNEETNHFSHQKMGKASRPKNLPTSSAFSAGKQRPTDPPPVQTLSPHHNGSNLLDSFELRAVTRQLKKAMLGSSGSSPIYLNRINSPFYRHRLDCIYTEHAKTPRRIICSKTSEDNLSRKVSARGTRLASGGFVTRLWKKVKQGLLWNKQRKKSLSSDKQCTEYE